MLTRQAARLRMTVGVRLGASVVAYWITDRARRRLTEQPSD